MYKLGKRSMKNLCGVNPILSYIVLQTIRKSRYDFSVFEGVRSLSKQQLYVSSGVSWTMNSKHLTGNAVDLVPYINGRVVWDGKKARTVFLEIYKLMNEEANKIGIDLICGANWNVSDLPHFELKRKDFNGWEFKRKD